MRGQAWPLVPRSWPEVDAGKVLEFEELLQVLSLDALLLCHEVRREEMALVQRAD